MFQRRCFRRRYAAQLILLSLFCFLQIDCSSSGDSEYGEEDLSIYVDPALPDEVALSVARISEELQRKASIVSNPLEADVSIIAGKIGCEAEVGKWYYALCSSFYTVIDTLEFKDLQRIWKRKDHDPPHSRAGIDLIMNSETARAMEHLLGPGSARLEKSEDLIDTLYKSRSSYTITPFHRLAPQLKTIDLDGFKLMEKRQNLDDYPLVLHISAIGKKEDVDLLKKAAGKKLLNRDESRMSILIMTGVTALTRQTAFMMEKRGIDFPASNIASVLSSADITHISNEVSFFPDCVLNKSSGNLKFCSSEKYLDLLGIVGADIIELSGNHLTDFGTEPFTHTLDLLTKLGFKYYAGGRNISEASKPLFFESGGNKIAFVGACAGPSYHFATETKAGPLKADWKMLSNQIKKLSEGGYIPVVTIQFQETYQYFPTAWQIDAFRMLADSGAAIVQGSQAHQPQSFDFHGSAFIHYGLGNLFFDQMWSLGTRQEFIDRHVFYENRHISTVLLTAMLEDYARPRLMSEKERKALLESIFKESFWNGKKYW